MKILKIQSLLHGKSNIMKSPLCTAFQLQPKAMVWDISAGQN